MDCAEIPKKRMCKAVRLSIIAEQLGIKVAGSTRKKTPSTKKAFPKRIAELNFSNDSPSTISAKKTNARKQLWSVDKQSRTHRISMKPNNGNIRKTICGKQSTVLKGKTKSVDQTLPLVDLEEYDANSILYKKLIVSQPKAKFNIAIPRNTVSKTNFAKPGISQNIGKLGTSRNIAKPVTSQNLAKPEASFNFAKPVAKFSIERRNSSKCLKGPPGSISKIPQPERKMESSKTDQMLEDILKYVTKLSEQVITINNRLDTIQTFIEQQALLNKTNEISNKIDDKTETGTMESVKKVTEDSSEFQEHLKLINEVHNKILIDETNKTMIKSESKKRSDTTSKFELLEQQIKNGFLNDSTSIASDPNSPFVEMGIEELISNNILYDDAFEATTNVIKNCDQMQSASTSIPHVSTPTDNLSEIEKTYNQMKNNLQFLCTPMVKKTVTVVTSTKLPNSHRKILSRRVQEQLCLLNDF